MFAARALGRIIGRPGAECLSELSDQPAVVNPLPASAKRTGRALQEQVAAVPRLSDLLDGVTAPATTRKGKVNPNNTGQMRLALQKLRSGREAAIVIIGVAMLCLTH